MPNVSLERKNQTVSRKPHQLDVSVSQAVMATMLGSFISGVRWTLIGREGVVIDPFISINGRYLPKQVI